MYNIVPLEKWKEWKELHEENMKLLFQNDDDQAHLFGVWWIEVFCDNLYSMWFIGFIEM